MQDNCLKLMPTFMPRWLNFPPALNFIIPYSYLSYCTITSNNNSYRWITNFFHFAYSAILDKLSDGDVIHLKVTAQLGNSYAILLTVM